MKRIEPYLERIRELCRSHHVRRLWVFGSVLTDRFHDGSDVDFLVDFEPADFENWTWDYVDNFFGFQDRLEQLMGRDVDLVVEKTLENPYFIRNVNRSRQKIYG